MPAALLILVLLPTFAGSYVENENPTLHRHHNHYKGWTGPPTTRPQNYRMDSPPIVLSETTDDWTSIAVTDVLNLEDSKYQSTLNYLDETPPVKDFAEKLASDFYLGIKEKDAPKDDHRGVKVTTDSGPRRESYVSETESGSIKTELLLVDVTFWSCPKWNMYHHLRVHVLLYCYSVESTPKWKTAPPPMTYIESTPIGTSVKERYVDLRSISGEEESSEEEYIPTGNTTTYKQGRTH